MLLPVVYYVCIYIVIVMHLNYKYKASAITIFDVCPTSIN